MATLPAEPVKSKGRNMKLFTFADLHLGDHRSSPEYDERKLENLTKLVSEIKPDFVVNIGDTVSKDEDLRDLDDKMKYWKRYVDFKKDLSAPVLEACLARERDFFSDLLKTECEYSLVKDGIGFISFDPLGFGDHAMTPGQIQWFTKEIEKLSGLPIVLMSHVPIAQTTLRREVGPIVYLTHTELIKNLTRKHAKFAIFLGGHFHTPFEPPRKEGKELMLMAGCFSFESAENSTYFRVVEINARNVEIKTIDNSMREILPVFQAVF